MTPTNLFEQLKRDEGYSLTKYPDPKGIMTIGIGHNLEAAPNFPDDTPIPDVITDEQCQLLFDADIARSNASLLSWCPWTATIAIDIIRLAVLRNMAFNMGMADKWPNPTHGLMTFKHTLQLIRDLDWPAAAAEMLHSAWAREVGARAHRLSQQMITGEWQ